MSQRVLISVLLLFCLNAGFLSAQVPTLDPSKTVNTATGEMGFSLPLGVVRGVNGHDFPVNLNYKAGIRVNQEASPSGLGFSYGAGEISRSVVFVPDDNVGGTDNYTVTTYRGCTIPNWLETLQFFCTGVSIGISIITGGAGQPVAIAGMLTSYAISAVPVIYSIIHASSVDFIAGGTHVQQYKPGAGQGGKGFFKGGEGADLPDVYFISTPYISGEFVWVGDAQTGHFVLKGSPNYGTVKIEKTTINIPGSALTNRMAFKVTLADGTRLIFNEIDAMPIFTLSKARPWTTTDGCIFQNCGRCVCYDASFDGIKESTTSSWHLTAVLPPGYIDGNGDDDPLNSKSSNNGAWVGFEYTPMEFTDHYMFMGVQQTNPYGTTSTCFGDPNSYHFEHHGESAVTTQPVRLSFLRKVHTPNECAVFNYAQPYDRADRFWKSHVDQTKLYEPRLNDIEFQNTAGTANYKVELQHNYSLKSKLEPGEDIAHAIPSLSLLSLNVVAGSKSNKITFGYSANPSVSDGYHYFAFIPGTVGDYPYIACMHQADMESKDLWGYYYYDKPSFTDYTDVTKSCIHHWNENGNDDFSVPDAWSVNSVSFPNGMTVHWDYEQNRYLYANGIEAKNVANVPVAKYGGGPRVKTVTVVDGMGKEYTRSYFYTNQPSVFIENAFNSSGYASVEPYPFNVPTDPRAGDKCKGGLYTPAKVAYSMVQVVDNYHEVDGNHPVAAPNGYTVYEFTHSGNPTIPGFFPNHGEYGEVDQAFKRGVLIKNTTYTAGHKKISCNEVESESFDFWLPHSRNLPLNQVNMFGLVRPVKSISNMNGVEQVTEYRYAGQQVGELNETPADLVSVNQRPDRFTYEKTYDVLPNLNESNTTIKSDAKDFWVVDASNVGSASIDDILLIERRDYTTTRCDDNECSAVFTNT